MSWTRGGIVGRGSEAAVSLATCRSSGTTLVAKSAEVSRSQSLRKEARILSALDSPHIVGYRGCDVTREGGGVSLFNLLLEYAPQGSLSDVIRKWGGLKEAATARYARQMLVGLDYLHSRGIVHCDLKPSNVLIGLGDCAKVADFGCAKKVDDAMTTIGGTPMYMAPEVALGVEQGCPADVWAFGCTIVEMASGKFPWTGVCDPVSAIHKIVYSGMTPEVPSHLSVRAKDFLEKCLRRDPKDRWLTSQLLDHPFLRQASCDLDFRQVEEFPFSPTSVMDREIWELAGVTSDVTVSPSSNRDSMDERVEKLSCSDQLQEGWSSDDDSGWMDVREEEEEEVMNGEYDDGLDTTTTNDDGDIREGVRIQEKWIGRSSRKGTSDSKQLNSSFL